jgi:cytochrome c556
MSWRIKVVIVCALVALSTGGPSGQSPGLKPIMREKLENTQRMLEAIVKQDFAAMGRHADSLGRISESEIASWQRTAQADYTKQALLFVLSVNGLREAAAGRNIDAAALEYTTLVSSCVGCHRRIPRTTTAEP